MLPVETVAEDQSPATSSPKSNGTASGDASADDSTPPVKLDHITPPKPESQDPPVKTDKPRPHVCTNCGRGFARLEHLKRHERSHTKEKPFECPECTRCFARRDLLLRHQQKLHFARNSTRTRGPARRESVGGAATASGRVRKNSVVNSAVGGTPALGLGGPRPRANTMGHVDLASMAVHGRPDMTNIHDTDCLGVSGLLGTGRLRYRGMSNAMGNHGPNHSLPKLDTKGLRNDFESALHTAPPYTGPDPFADDLFGTPITGSTVNPAQLHFAGSIDSPSSPYPHMTPAADQPSHADDFSWLQNWDNPQTLGGNEFAIDESSPSIMDSTGLLQPADLNIDLQSFAFATNMNGVTTWPPPDPMTQPLMTPTAFHLDALSNGLPNLDGTLSTLSPQHLRESVMQDSFFNTTLPQNVTNGMHSHRQSLPPQSMSNFDSDSPSMASSMTGSARQSSVTSVSTSSITDATRQALVISLAQPSVFGHNPRKYSQPSISSPLSPGGILRSNSNLPATPDLQRYITAYIQSFHPHLPFLHTPTLSFDTADYLSNLRHTNGQTSFGHNGIIGGGGCLILAMAAIGALYEYDHAVSRELFESAKRMIQLYLEERRKADMSAALNGQHIASGNTAHNTPLWLVQAMLLNVIYGHHCGDKQAAEIASTHCAALVSLARAAELAQPSSVSTLSEDGSSPGTQAPHTPQSSVHRAWLTWKAAEERKRTLYAVFTLSSLLVIAYNHAPAIMNSEIQLDLPCDEDLWAAENSAEWIVKGGLQVAEHGSPSFESALSRLLAANQHSDGTFNDSTAHVQNAGLHQQPGNPLDARPSTFGCLVLINALHNYIWETRNRHVNRNWTPSETESMFAHIEPALNAWQAAWRSNEHHHLQRPNPFGLGPLSADCIPLLDLAFVRLFVNPGRSKEAFWQRDFDAMSSDFVRGAEIHQHNSASSPAGSGSSASHDVEGNVQARQGLRRPSQTITNGQGSRRERQLRRAAFYAADALSIACKLMLTYADMCSHELPMQAAICFFDCSQVLAEWSATVQERVGRYLGVLGRESIDYTQVPAIMLLEAEDTDLIMKLEQICMLMEEKLVQYAQAYGLDNTAGSTTSTYDGPPEKLPQLVGLGHGAKLLKVTALMLEKSAVWPVTYVMANALDVQATHTSQRAETSVPHFQQ